MDTNYIVRLCKVIKNTDDTDGKRIVVRLFPEDNATNDDNLPYVFPLLPKMINITPKVGESVFVFLASPTNADGNRYYVGPVISQPQMMLDDPHDFSARSLLQGSIVSPQVAPSTNPETEGSMPDLEDVAILGRQTADIFLKRKELQLRCGTHSVNNTTDLIFNKLDPAYIQMKFHSPVDNNEGGTYRSHINIVADKINLLSHQSKTPFSLTDKTDLISDEEMTKILENAHQLPYGDTLVNFLKLLIKSYSTHSHPYAGLPPVMDDSIIQVINYDLDTILSKSIRIN